MQSNYNQSLTLVLVHEGGYVNHPSDPGGPTNHGITQKVYDDYKRVYGLAMQSVKLITNMEVAAIYANQYWRLIRGADLPAGLDYAVFDFAVNSGISRAVRYLQRQVNVKDDAILGNGTLGAVLENFRKNEETFICQYIANRVAFLKGLHTFSTFGKGWMRRVLGVVDGVQENDTGVIDYAIKMVKHYNIYDMPETQSSAKAFLDDTAYFPTADLSELSLQNDNLNAEIVKSLARAA